MPTDTYKVVLGDRTLVKKVVIGTPLDNVTINQYADIDNLVGVDTTGKSDGNTLVYDSDSGNFVTTRDPVLEVDGKFYPSDSAHTNILIRRSGTQGQPLLLQQGEMAYSFLEDPLTDGFGNGGDRLYIATGADSAGNSTRIDVIGGRYFTNLLNHQQGELTAQSALITDSDKRLDQILADSATFTIARADTAINDKTATRVIQPLESEDAVTFITNQDVTLMTVNDSAGVIISHHLNGENDSRQIFATEENGVVIGLPAPSPLRTSLTVHGLSFLDSTDVGGDLDVIGDFEQSGVSSLQAVQRWSTTARFLSLATNANAGDLSTIDSAGIKVGSPSNPLAYIKYKYRAAESDCWDFSDGICAPKLEVERFDFEIIDCGTYA